MRYPGSSLALPHMFSTARNYRYINKACKYQAWNKAGHLIKDGSVINCKSTQPRILDKYIVQSKQQHGACNTKYKTRLEIKRSRLSLVTTMLLHALMHILAVRLRLNGLNFKLNCLDLRKIKLWFIIWTGRSWEVGWDARDCMQSSCI